MAARRTLAGLVAVPALALPAVLAGCGDDSSIADPPVASPPHSVATSDPPARESAEHFIRRWAEAEKRMENTGRTAVYLALSKGCTACTTLSNLVTRYYENGGFIEWAGWTNVSITRYPARDGHIAFSVQSNSSGTRYKTSADASVQRLAGGPITYVLTLRPDGASFHVISKAQLAE